jgi:maltooligosyltrehalose trehalohydrolase
VPDPNAESTFTDSGLDWSEAEQEPHATLLTLHRELIALRRAHPELTDPWLEDVEVDVDEDARTVVLHRGRLRTAVNLGGDEVTLALNAPIDRILLASEPVEGHDDALTLRPESFAVVALRDRP